MTTMLKIYAFRLSQTSRAIIIFSKANGFEFEEVQVYLLKGEHKTSQYKEKYDPIYAKWTTERCAICRWVEDWDYNKVIICNRCQIAVHQECYGTKNIKDFTSW
ncbi:Histone-lysine n-methyltransferase atx5, partial [Thalictrum thalictroides]